MNKKAIWAIIILMSTAVIGITIMQVRWINWSIQLQQNQFSANVYAALNSVKSRLLDDERIKKDINENLLKANPTTGLGDWNDQLDRWIRKGQLKEKGITLNNLNIANPNVADFEITDLDKDKVDKYLRQELSNWNIDLDHRYGVYSNDDKSFVILNGNYTFSIGDEGMTSNVEKNKGLVTSEYIVQLYPDDEGSPGYLQIFFPSKRSWLLGRIWLNLLSTIIFISLILVCFAYTIYVIFRQKKVSEMKTDFINNMTHEFKTPIATISLAADSITSPMILSNEQKVKRFADVIKQENKRMLSQVEKVLQMALIDKDEFQLKLTEVNMHDLINQAASNANLQVQKRGGSVKVNLNADNPVLEGDRTHLSNIIHNLLDNANKYSPEEPIITVESNNVANGVEVRISDQGIGMSKEARKQIFDKFYRVHTGNIHDVKGFGLGLSYVKAMMTAHKGQIDVKSELGKGSTFILIFPFRQAV